MSTIGKSLRPASCFTDEAQPGDVSALRPEHLPGNQRVSAGVAFVFDPAQRVVPGLGVPAGGGEFDRIQELPVAQAEDGAHQAGLLFDGV